MAVFFLIVIVFFCIVVFTIISEESKQKPAPMDMDSFFEMKKAIFRSTAFQREKCSYAGQRVKAEGEVVEIRRSNHQEDYAPYKNYILLHVVVEVSRTGSYNNIYGERFLVSWEEKCYKESDLSCSKYLKYGKGDRIEFEGEVAKSQGEDRIRLTGYIYVN